MAPMGRFGAAFRLTLAVGILGNSMGLWAEVQMKTREGQTGLANRMSRAKSRVETRSHLILDFPETPTPETARLLAARGMRVVAYLPLTGVIVGVEGAADLRGLNLAGFDALQPEDKLSQELTRAAGDDGRRARVDRLAYFVVEFHGDVPWEERRALVSESGVEIRDHKDLVGDHMLVRGTLAKVRTLAEWDEVAYIFPASGELVTGLPLVGCVGGATEAGQVGQLTQRIGEGWDGVGLNRANLTYSFQGGVPQRLAEAQVQDEIQRAMAAWSGVVQVAFQRTNNTAAAKNINILFGSRDHGDPYPFDGAGKVLAHTFYPAPPNPEPIAGDLHFDNDENWNLGTDIDIFSVALHELGHALGLGHSDVPNAVMYPYYRRTTALTPEDIGAIRLLYAAVSDTDASPAPLVLTLSAPANAAKTSGAAIHVTGTLTGPVGAPVMAWATNRGMAGAGSVSADGRGGFQWQMTSVPLAMGENQITVTASDTAGRSISRAVEVRREAATVVPVPPAPVPPTPVPAMSVSVTSPGTGTITTRNPSSANGFVTGGTGRPTVRWSSDRESGGVAVVTATTDGRYRWDANPIGLLLGPNPITVTATDTANRTSSVSLLIIYKYPSDEGAPTAPAPPPTPTPIPALSLDVASPGVDTIVTRNPITASGTVAGSTGQPSVRWSSDRGFTGTAAVTAIPDGKYRWDANPIALLLGANTITITATDAANRISIRNFRVNYSFTPPDVPDADTQPPRITIISPKTTFLMTPSYSISVRGTAQDVSGVAAVRWECSCGSQGTAQGTTQWTVPNISLPAGTHKIKIFATDSVGNEGTAEFLVMRYEN